MMLYGTLMDFTSTTQRFEQIYRNLIVADVKKQLRPLFAADRISDSDAAYALSVASRLALFADGTTTETASTARKAYEVAIRTHVPWGPRRIAPFNVLCNKYHSLEP